MIRVKEDGVYYEADPRHAELIIQSLGLQGANSLSTPGDKDKSKATQEEGHEGEEQNTEAEE